MPDQMEAQIQALTQNILKEQIGDLVLTCARLRAEKIVREQVAAEAAERCGTVDGAQGADGPQTEGESHG